MIELEPGINRDRPDATFDLDGTVFKMTVLETYTEWLSQQSVFDPLPIEIVRAKQAWKEDNTEQNYAAHMGKLVRFFVEQIAGKSVSQMDEAAHIVANQQKHRRWNITTAIIKEMQPTHNVMAISLMPEQLMAPFVRDLGFVALIGSAYTANDGFFTGEARTINKAEEYATIRDGDTSKLDVHMGDTVGDVSLFELARRPILFNPSWTLYQQTEASGATIIKSNKDLVTVMNPGSDPGYRAAKQYGPPFDTAAILKEVRQIN